uniref:tRNA wybutosine-synthesizing protein 4 n=1 Tax=Xiphophorus couchianus TaxID=32473 RepID=A0A3B5LLP1_9TELE
AVDHCVRRFLLITAKCPKRQVLSLGAGFDSLYFRLCADGALDGTAVFEVDFPDVARRKALNFYSTITYLFSGPVYMCSSQYRLLGVDVREESQTEEALSAAGLDWAAPTLILSEVVLTYMETQRSDAVIGWAAKRLPQSLFVMYEQICPDDPFGRVMQDHFLKLNSTLHALQQYPDLSAQRQRFLDKGWERCVCVDMNAFYLGLVPQEERDRIETLEPFDEYEEWHQKCSHYFILTASRGALMEQALLSQASVPSVSPSWGSTQLKASTVPVCLEGLGLASTWMRLEGLLLTGGSSRGGRVTQSRSLVRDQNGWRWSQWTVRGILPHQDLDTLPQWSGTKVSRDQTSGPSILTPSLSVLNPCFLFMVGRHFLFVFGGKNQSLLEVNSGNFVSFHYDPQFPVGGDVPAARHSHSACSYLGSVVVFGGLSREGEPLGDLSLLTPTERGFDWIRVAVHPPPVPRSVMLIYSQLDESVEIQKKELVCVVLHCDPPGSCFSVSVWMYPVLTTGTTCWDDMCQVTSMLQTQLFHMYEYL